MPLVLTKPFQVTNPARESARLIASNLAGRCPLLFAYGINDASLIRTDLEGRAEGVRTPIIVNTPDSGWINLYRRQDGTLYVGQPKATREEAEAGLARNAPNNNMTYIKTVEVVA